MGPKERVGGRRDGRASGGTNRFGLVARSKCTAAAARLRIFSGDARVLGFAVLVLCPEHPAQRPLCSTAAAGASLPCLLGGGGGGGGGGGAAPDGGRRRASRARWPPPATLVTKRAEPPSPPPPLPSPSPPPALPPTLAPLVSASPPHPHIFHFTGVMGVCAGSAAACARWLLSSEGSGSAKSTASSSAMRFFRSVTCSS